MKKEIKFYQSIPAVALVTLFILMVPFTAMQFTDEVKWTAADFILAGALLFGSGLSFVLAMRNATNIIYKAAIGLALGAMFFMIWANLAVGLIGKGPNPGNLMYIGVIAVGISGIILSRLKPHGLAHTMYAMALALVLIAVIALNASMHQYPGSSMAEIIGVNGFFAILFSISGLLFRFVAHDQSQRIEKSQG